MGEGQLLIYDASWPGKVGVMETFSLVYYPLCQKPVRWLRGPIKVG